MVIELLNTAHVNWVEWPPDGVAPTVSCPPFLPPPSFLVVFRNTSSLFSIRLFFSTNPHQYFFPDVHFPCRFFCSFLQLHLLLLHTLFIFATLVLFSRYTFSLSFLLFVPPTPSSFAPHLVYLRHSGSPYFFPRPFSSIFNHFDKYMPFLPLLQN